MSAHGPKQTFLLTRLMSDISAHAADV